jgi:C-terminal processing protease CtpA/Prc
VGAYLKFKQRAVFIGEETGGAIEGCNAGITPYYKLPNTKIKVRIPAFRIINDVSPQITGRGILPDYPITYSIKDILARRDLELIKVKELIEP